ncbi:hypothetical protein PTTG_30276, partial [Puccinia triticina 1-1 BBBD Race 1]
ALEDTIKRIKEAVGAGGIKQDAASYKEAIYEIPHWLPIKLNASSKKINPIFTFLSELNIHDSILI